MAPCWRIGGTGGSDKAGDVREIPIAVGGQQLGRGGRSSSKGSHSSSSSAENLGHSGAHTSFPSNIIITSKYTVLNFLPKNIWEQLHKAANSYFLAISFVMFLGNKTELFEGTINFASTFATLVVMMAFSAVIAALDDRQRHRADAVTNSQVALRVARGECQEAASAPGASGSGGAGQKYTTPLESVEWRDIRVGDVLVVKGEQDFPADLVPLACSGDEGTCYVSTANLDGETNLKIKQAAAMTQDTLCSSRGSGSASAGGSGADAGAGCGPEDESEDVADGSPTTLGMPLLDRAVRRLPRIEGSVRAEPPQKSIHNFTGSLAVSAVRGGAPPAGKPASISLGPQQLLLRGTQLRNTAWCVGLVVYTGAETRMAMNSRAAPSKCANIEKTINRGLMVVIGTQAALAMVCNIAYNVTISDFVRLWYLYPTQEPRQYLMPSWVASWFTFFVLFSNLMPISLYATMEVCNFAQAFFLQNDLEMYDEEQDCAAKARSTNLGHELGQVSYIFSDKTGTLTQNVMELKQVSIAGKICGQVGGAAGFQGGLEIEEAGRRDANFARAVDDFFEVLAVSHTVVVTEDQSGALRYEAESPDEGALVEAAAGVGWRFVGRKGQTMSIDRGKSGPTTYNVLALNAFTSSRKRQSVVVQRSTGELLLLVKGADNVMLERAAHVDPTVNAHLKEFAEHGLRTLVLGRRSLTEEQFLRFREEYAKAQVVIDDRESALASAAESIERNLEVVGVTAIEDKLQVGVEDTIEKVRAAGIKLWVLTGDKLETARNIGFSTRVLSNEMNICILDAAPGEREATVERLRALAPEAITVANTGRQVALLVTGQALEELYSASADEEFLKFASICCVVIACRVSPSQKAQMVRLVRKGVKPAPVTLAIGDGANDVPMIQEAQVGVGISGREGKQAVNSADFGIAQFRYLQRLLLVHGRWNYRRACKFTLYSFWKNAVLVLLLFYYSFASGYAGTSLFEDWVRASYNIILSAPIIAVGVFDRDVMAEDALANPELYDTGRRGLDLNAMKLVETMLSAFVHSGAILCMMAYALPHFTGRGTGDYFTFGTGVYTWLIITMNYRVAFLTTTWNWLSVLSLVLSFLSYVVFLLVYCYIQWDIQVFSFWMYYVPTHMAATPVFWMGCLVAPALALVIDIFKAYMLLEFFPDRRDIILETAGKKRLKKDDEESPPRRASSRASSLVASVAPEWVLDFSKSSSFVFDHPEGPPKKVSGLRAAHPTAGDTSLTEGVHESRESQRRASRQSTTRSSGSTVVRVGQAAAAADVEQGEVPTEKVNKPYSGNFSQQALPSWQLVLTWRVTFIVAAICGLLLIAVGLGTWATSNSVRYLALQYDGDSSDLPTFGLEGLDLTETGNDTSCTVRRGESRTCELKIEIREDMQAPIWVDFVVDPFFQNYPTYLNSFSKAELTGQVPPASMTVGSCEPLPSRKTADGLRIFPCGLQATSLFNDTFTFFEGRDRKPMPVDRSGIAWPSDLGRFANPKGYPDDLPGMSLLPDRFPQTVPRETGTETASFAVWMRPAAAPRTHKRYGVLTEPLAKGQTLAIRIGANFPVSDWGGRKRLVLMSESSLGGPDDGLSFFLLVAGILCWVAAGVVLAIRACCGRKRGALHRRCVAVANGTEEEASPAEAQAPATASTASSPKPRLLGDTRGASCQAPAAAASQPEGCSEAG